MSPISRNRSLPLPDRLKLAERQVHNHALSAMALYALDEEEMADVLEEALWNWYDGTIHFAGDDQGAADVPAEGGAA